MQKERKSLWSNIRGVRWKTHSSMIGSKACLGSIMPPAPESEDMSVASADFLADGMDAANARQDAVMKCPSCGETMFIGGMCSCSYEDDTIPDGDL